MVSAHTFLYHYPRITSQTLFCCVQALTASTFVEVEVEYVTRLVDTWKDDTQPFTFYCEIKLPPTILTAQHNVLRDTKTFKESEEDVVEDTWTIVWPLAGVVAHHPQVLDDMNDWVAAKQLVLRPVGNGSQRV